MPMAHSPPQVGFDFVFDAGWIHAIGVQWVFDRKIALHGTIGHFEVPQRSDVFDERNAGAVLAPCRPETRAR